MTTRPRFGFSFVAAAIAAAALSVGACSSDNPPAGPNGAGSGQPDSASGSGAGTSGSRSGATGGSGSVSGSSGAAGSGVVASSGAAGSGGSASGSGAGSGSIDLSEAGTSGSVSTGAPDGGSGSPAGDAGTPPPFGDAGANLVSLFDGTTLNGWVQVPAASWSVVNGTLHSLGTARGVLYTTQMYGDFRFLVSSRLISDPLSHYPCVLFWGNALNADALHGIQVQPPRGYMWDYRATGPTANKAPSMFTKTIMQPNLSDTQWSRCEILGNKAAGTMRFACCQLTGTATTCKATEIVDFRDPTAGQTAPLALQVHNTKMIEEFKDLYVESPVADPSKLLTTQ